MSDTQYHLLAGLIEPPISGGRPSGGVSSDTEGVPSIGGENIVSTGGMDYSELKRIPEGFYLSMPKGKLCVNDVLINKDGAQTGKVGIYDGRFDHAAVNEHVFILRARDPEKLDQRYLYYCILLPDTRRKIERRITGSAQPGLNSQFVRAVSIPYRDIGRQKKIGGILQTIDHSIEKTEALIEKYQQIKAGLMHDLFTRGIGADGKLRPPREQAPELYQETPNGWIPKEWKVKRTGELCLSIVPGRNKPDLDDGELPWVTISDLDSLYVYESVAGLSLSRGSLKMAQGRTVPRDAVVMSCVGSFGTVAIAEREIVINQQLHAFVIEDEVIPEWLAYNLERQKSYMEKIATQTTILYLNKSACESVPIVLPPLGEQLKIVDKIQSITTKILIEKQVVSKFEKQKSGLMHDLLTGKVEVKTDKLEEANV